MVGVEERLVHDRQKGEADGEGDREHGHRPRRRPSKHRPPSTPTTAPLMKDARSEARKTYTLATSSAGRRRRAAVRAKQRGQDLLRHARDIPVSMKPGATRWR